MGHVCLVESLLDLLAVILVEHVDHGTLAQRCQRLVCRLGRVDADAGPGGVRQQPHIEQGLVVFADRLQILGEFGVLLPVARLAQPVEQSARRCHCSA